MSSPLAYGIDFGTTNSSIAVAYTNRVELVPLSTNPAMPYCLPSIVYLHKDGIKEAGNEALESYNITGGLKDQEGNLVSRLIFEIKTALTSEGISESYRKLPEYVAVILRALKERADQHTGQNINKAVIGHPVAFLGATGPDDTVANNLAKERLKEAAHQSGFSEVELYPEPRAAALGEGLGDGITITVDFGGGTFDVAVAKPLMKNPHLQGVEVGGSLFDELIFDHKLTDKLGLNSKIGPHSLPVDPQFINNLRGRRGFHRLLTDHMTWAIVEDITKTNPSAGEDLQEVIFGGHAGGFYSAIENAKISLADQPNTYIDYDSADLELFISLHREEFDQWITPSMGIIQETIQRAMDEVSVSPGDVKHVIRTGGSSQLLAFTEMLNNLFGPEKVLNRDALATVVYGLGIRAQEIWVDRPQAERRQRRNLPGESNNDSENIPESGPPDSELPEGWKTVAKMAEERGHTLGPPSKSLGATPGSKYYYAFCTKCKKRATASYIWPEMLPESQAYWHYGGDAIVVDCPQS